MNKAFRYLIFALLVIGVGYAVYSLINRPAAVVQEVEVVATENKEGENAVDPKVASDTDVQPEDQNLATVVDGQKVAEEVSEDKAAEEEVVPAEEVKVEEVKKEEVANKISKPAKR